MNRALDLSRSELAAVVASKESVIVKLRPAHVHESAGRCGVDPGRALSQDIDVTFGGARLVNGPAEMPARIGEGTLFVSGSAVAGPLPLPVRFKGQLLLRIVTGRGEELTVEAAWAESTLVGRATAAGEGGDA